jgi:hypothetical protein
LNPAIVAASLCRQPSERHTMKLPSPAAQAMVMGFVDAGR